jgi:hypothetical protein
MHRVHVIARIDEIAAVAVAETVLASTAEAATIAMTGAVSAARSTAQIVAMRRARMREVMM